VLLTTQYLEEADQLADRISMLRAGRVVTEGTPEELKSALGGDWLDIVLADAADMAATEAIAVRIASGEVHLDGEARRVSVPVAERTRALVTMATALGDAGVEPVDITLRRPTLDEVFLHLMGEQTAIDHQTGEAAIDHRAATGEQAVIDDRAATDDRAGEPPGGGDPAANRPASAGPATGTEAMV
jgi:ABC-2 type transport system ATP-binding protein